MESLTGLARAGQAEQGGPGDGMQLLRFASYHSDDMSRANQ